MSICFLFKRNMISRGNLFLFGCHNHCCFCLILQPIVLSSLSLINYLINPIFVSSYNLSIKIHLIQQTHSSNSLNHQIIQYLKKISIHHMLMMCTCSLFAFIFVFLLIFLALKAQHLRHFMAFDSLYLLHRLQNFSFTQYIRV